MSADKRRRRRVRPVSLRGDTYGAVCAVLFILVVAGGILFFRYAGSASKNVAQPKPQPMGYALTLPTSPSPSPSPAVLSADDLALRDAMENSRALGARQLMSRGAISPMGGGFRASFEYEKRDAIECVRVNNASFVRQVNSPWARGEEWTPNLASVSAVETSFLDDLVNIVGSPWKVAAEPAPAQMFGGADASLPVYAKGKPDAPEQLFALKRSSAGLRLSRFSGLIRSGGDDVEVTLDFNYPASPEIASSPPGEKPASTPSAKIRSEPKPKPASAGKNSRGSRDQKNRRTFLGRIRSAISR